MYRFQLVDSLLPIIYLFLLLGIAWMISQSYDAIGRLRFRQGIAIKMVGCLSFLLIYILYFKSGDTFLYYTGASRVWQIFTENPWNGLQLIWLPSGENVLAYADITLDPLYANSTAEWTLTKIAGIANLFCFNNYICLSMCFAAFSFLGTWGIYRVFTDLYPAREKQLFAVIFLIPSCLIWTSGVLKDSVCLGLIGIIFHAVHKVFKKEKIGRRIPVILLSFYLISLIKPYLAYAFLCCLVLWVYFRLIENSKNAVLKQGLGLFLFLCIFLVATNLFKVIQGTEKQVVFQESVDRIKGYHYEYERDKGKSTSSYSLGQADYSASGILKKAPLAIITTLFRPYIWESRKMLMLLMSLENLFYLSLLVWLLTRSQFWKMGLRVFNNSEILFCIAFVIILGLIVGITTYNYGLLMRLKTPLMPFLGVGLVLIYEQIAKKQIPIVVAERA